MTELRGAYARGRKPLATVVAARPATAVPEYLYDGPHWQVHLDTSAGRWHFQYRLNEEKARGEYARYEWLGWHGQALVVGNVTVVSGALIAPDGAPAASWGEPPLDLDRPRWRPLTRLTHETWRFCPGCGELLWPYRIVAAVLDDPRAGWANDAVCRDCLIGRESDDPRPSWGGEPYLPYVHQRPTWVRKHFDQQARAAGRT